jgi:sec-independent protein translocase protein TatA
MMSPLFGLFDILGMPGILIIGVIAVLLYGERLPEVARSFGKQFMELKRSVQGIRDDFEQAARDAMNSAEQTVRDSVTTKPPREDREEAPAPKFVPPPSEPGSEPQPPMNA